MRICDRRHFVLAAATMLTFPSLAQVAKKARIGYYGSASPDWTSAHLVAAFVDALRELGYTEGRNIEFEWRPGTNGEAIAAEFVRLKVDIIVAANTVYATAARKVTDRIPIVTVSGDPIKAGLVRSLAHPGGNVTGVTPQTTDIIGKQLELLKQLTPHFRRVALLWNPNNRFHRAQLEEAEALVRKLGGEPHPVAAGGPEQLDGAFAEIAKLRADAVLVLADGVVFHNHRKRLAALAAKHHAFVMYPRREHVDVGGLISYGTDRRDMFRRLAVYVDKILKGASPADLPVEQANKFELVINRRAERALGIRIPQSILGRADELID